MKLNFDGSSKHSTGIASISAVLRRGLELAVQNGWRLIWAEGDSKVMVDVVRDRADMQSEKDLRLCREIATLLPQLDDMAVFHVCRGGNKSTPITLAARLIPLWHHRLDANEVGCLCSTDSHRIHDLSTIEIEGVDDSIISVETLKHRSR
ncbi:hypothetical protein OsI_00539 [Oryza sativa Indica Group]|uniref:RNase H type-1 domain-containing protein n=1 Tax=Oryza sativa subsp. indica TaxID=39946 RepID=B8ADF5_ORYSI|nr:hypothetical protein OsI_00539 [Oryza sativa Indica Group]